MLLWFLCLRCGWWLVGWWLWWLCFLVVVLWLLVGLGCGVFGLSMLLFYLFGLVVLVVCCFDCGFACVLLGFLFGFILVVGVVVIVG